MPITKMFVNKHIFTLTHSHQTCISNKHIYLLNLCIYAKRIANCHIRSAVRKFLPCVRLAGLSSQLSHTFNRRALIKNVLTTTTTSTIPKAQNCRRFHNNGSVVEFPQKTVVFLLSNV